MIVIKNTILTPSIVNVRNTFLISVDLEDISINYDAQYPICGELKCGQSIILNKTD